MLARIIAPVALLILAGCTTENPTWQAGDPTPLFSMDKDGSIFTVTNIKNGPVPVADVEILNDGCTWTTTNGATVRIGDAITCTDDDVLTLAHGPSGARIYTNCSGCTNPPGPQAPADAGTKPSISFTKDSSARTLTVASADADADWYEIRSNSDCEPNYNGQPIPDGARVAPSPDSISAGDKIFMNQGDCQITLTHIPSSEAYGTWSFA